jgi:hypothetical protein
MSSPSIQRRLWATFAVTLLLTGLLVALLVRPSPDLKPDRAPQAMQLDEPPAPATSNQSRR